MVKYDLRRQGFSMEQISTKRYIINILWAGIALVMIFGTVIALMMTVGYVNWTNSSDALIVMSDPARIPQHLIMALGLLILYFALKLLMTVIFCSDKIHSIQLKVLEGKGMPVCFCREALKTWQIIVMYLVPFIIVYGAMFGISAWQIYSDMEYGFLVMLLFVSFFLAFDLALVIYVIAIKVKDKINYISIDYHIYEITLYKQALINFSGKAGQKQAVPIIDTYKSDIFTPINRACGNPKCENYAHELEENLTICPICGKRTFKAEIFGQMNTCINKNCEEYGHELKDDINVCSICGEETGKLALKFNPGLVKPCVILSLITAVVVLATSLFITSNEIEYGSLRLMMYAAQFILWGLSIGVGIASKSKNAVIGAISSLPVAYCIYMICIMVITQT